MQRWLKFVKYLPACGWTPVVVCPEGAHYPALDTSLEDEVASDVEMLRLPIFEPQAYLDRLGSKSGGMPQGASAGGERTSKLRRAMSWIRGNVFIPDARALWVGPAAKGVKRYLREHPVDAIVSTGPPHSVHLIALRVKQAFPEVPWLADFRDPWSDMDYLDDFQLTAWSRKRHRTLEQRVVAACDELVITAPSAAQSLLRRSLAAGEKGAWVPNGYDEADGFNAVQPDEEGPLVLGFFGSLYGSRNAPGLWRAVRRWNDAGDGRPIRLDFYGSVSPEVEASLQEALPAGGWELRGNIPHEEVPDAMARCHGLVLIQNNNRTGMRTIPGKVFEYLATQRPLIVGGALDSDLQRLVNGWGLKMSAMEDVDGFYEQLAAAARNTLPQVDPTEYRRDRLTQRMALLLDQITTTK